MRLISVLLCLSLLAIPEVSVAQQPPSAEEALQGLLTEDKLQNRALAEALKRGYLRGFDDAQRQCKAEMAKAKAEMAKALSDCKRSK